VLRRVRYTITNRQQGTRPVGDQFEVPQTFTLKVDDPNVACLVELDVDNTGPEPECVVVRCARRQDGPPVTGAMLRGVRVAAYLREGTDEAVQRVHVVDSRRLGRPRKVRVWPVPDDEQEAYRQARRSERRPNERIPDADLARAADVYRQALRLGQAPVPAVQRELRLRSRAQAARWVSKARAAGFLGPAKGPGARGEKPS
jgi:hypothetical protein